MWAATRPTLAAGFLLLLADRSHIPLGPGLPRPGTVARPAAGTGYWRPWPAVVGRRPRAPPRMPLCRAVRMAVETPNKRHVGHVPVDLRSTAIVYAGPRGMRRERLRTHPDRPCCAMRRRVPVLGGSQSTLRGRSGRRRDGLHTGPHSRPPRRPPGTDPAPHADVNFLDSSSTQSLIHLYRIGMARGAASAGTATRQRCAGGERRRHDPVRTVRRLVRPCRGQQRPPWPSPSRCSRPVEPGRRPRGRPPAPRP